MFKYDNTSRRDALKVLGITSATGLLGMFGTP